MEFLKRKHFSLWIITTFVLVAGVLDGCVGLQGVPTWITFTVKCKNVEEDDSKFVTAAWKKLRKKNNHKLLSNSLKPIWGK
ncbi:unnamed protein product, partial [Ceratitis capitata]